MTGQITKCCMSAESNSLALPYDNKSWRHMDEVKVTKWQSEGHDELIYPLNLLGEFHKDNPLNLLGVFCKDNPLNLHWVLQKDNPLNLLGVFCKDNPSCIGYCRKITPSIYLVCFVKITPQFALGIAER